MTPPFITTETIYRVQNDTGPDEQFTVRRAMVDDTGKVTYEVVDLTGYTVKFVIKSLLTDSVTNGAHQTCNLDDPTNGLCSYRFITGDLPDPGGDYECELELTDAGGLAETGYSLIKLRTRAELG